MDEDLAKLVPQNLIDDLGDLFVTTVDEQRDPFILRQNSIIRKLNIRIIFSYSLIATVFFGILMYVLTAKGLYLLLPIALECLV